LIVHPKRRIWYDGIWALEPTDRIETDTSNNLYQPPSHYFVYTLFKKKNVYREDADINTNLNKEADVHERHLSVPAKNQEKHPKNSVISLPVEEKKRV
jgi:hypothetical protein